MTDEELLEMAKRNKVLLLRFDSGDIKNGFKAIKDEFFNSNDRTASMQMAANVVTAVEAFIFLTDPLPEYKRIEEALGDK